MKINRLIIKNLDKNKLNTEEKIKKLFKINLLNLNINLDEIDSSFQGVSRFTYNDKDKTCNIEITLEDELVSIFYKDDYIQIESKNNELCIAVYDVCNKNYEYFLSNGVNLND
jgi:hypothetical protein